MARHKGLWFLVSMGCYMTGVGGVIYCIIRNPNSHGFNQVSLSIPCVPVEAAQMGREGGGVRISAIQDIFEVAPKKSTTETKAVVVFWQTYGVCPSSSSVCNVWRLSLSSFHSLDFFDVSMNISQYLLIFICFCSC